MIQLDFRFVQHARPERVFFESKYGSCRYWEVSFTRLGKVASSSRISKRGSAERGARNAISKSNCSLDVQHPGQYGLQRRIHLAFNIISVGGGLYKVTEQPIVFSSFMDIVENETDDDDGKIVMLHLEGNAIFDVLPIIKYLRMLNSLRLHNCRSIPLELGDLPLEKLVILNDDEQACTSIPEEM